jgi:hypothetical protein
VISGENPYAYADEDENSSWIFFSAANARDYLRRRRDRVTPGRATPFLSDCQSRDVFMTVPLDNVREE